MDGRIPTRKGLFGNVARHVMENELCLPRKAIKPVLGFVDRSVQRSKGDLNP